MRESQLDIWKCVPFLQAFFFFVGARHVKSAERKTRTLQVEVIKVYASEFWNKNETPSVDNLADSLS